MATIPTNAIGYYSPCLQGSLSMAVLQRKCGGVFVTNRAVTLKHFRTLYPDVQTKRRYRHFNWVGGHRFLKQAKIVFAGAGYREYLSQLSAKKCLVFHGTFGGIDETFIRSLTHFDHLFLIGPRMKQELLRYYDQCNVPFSVSGFLPFTLYPEKDEVTCTEILVKLGLNPSKKTVLYTPSKASVGTWHYCAENIARETPTNFNLVMRPHPNQAFSSKYENKTSFRRINKIIKDRPDSIIDLVKCSLPELECIADLVISDANSPAEESLFYDCAQLFADTNRSGRKAFRERFKAVALHDEEIEGYLQLFDCGPEFYADGYNDWATAIQEAFDNKDKYETARSKCFAYIFGKKDQMAAERVLRTIQGML